jgi:hypothetical protein
LGLLDVEILTAIEAAGALHDRPYVKTQRALDVLRERTGIGPNQAYESLCDMARPYVNHLLLVDFHGNYGSPDFGPAAPATPSAGSRNWARQPSLRNVVSSAHCPSR